MHTIIGAVHMLKYVRAEAANGTGYEGLKPVKSPLVRSARTTTTMVMVVV